MLRRLLPALIALLILAIAITGCSKSNKGPLGSADNPIKMALVPSLDSQKLASDGQKLGEMLKKETGLNFEVSVPTSYAAVVAAMGAGSVDIGWLSPLPYVIAHEQYGVKVALTTVRDNSTKYWSFIIARNDNGINKLADLKGKRFAYGDSLSTSGCLYAKDLLRAQGYNPETYFSNVIYAGAHDKVVMAVYNKQVDAGAIYGGVATDAREKVLKTLPDVMQKTKVIVKSAQIPNDTVSIRKDLPVNIENKVTNALLKIAKSDNGQMILRDVYGIDGFVPAKDSDYDSVRKVVKAEKITIEKIAK